MSSYKEYEFVIVGAGIAGCSLGYFLSQYTDSILLIDKNSDVAFGASGAAGAFLSPLLGKPNSFKELITKSLKFSTKFYQDNFPELITNCGTCRIPKNNEDKLKFESYKPHMDFEYKEYEEGYFFEVGSVVKPYEVCKKLTKEIDKLFDYKVECIEHQKDKSWVINSEIKAKNLLLATGADISLINEKYLNIRPVWGQKIDISSTTCIDINYHKECSLSKSVKLDESDKYITSIGATHHRFDEDMSDTSYDLNKVNINKSEHNSITKSIIEGDSDKLITLANDIKHLDDIEVLDVKIGARASSVDYFPMVGKLVDSKSSIENSPHIVNGSFINDEKLSMADNLYVLNGVGGRGFVLSLYLANQLVENIINNQKLDDEITTLRLFKRWVKRVKNKKKK